MVSNFILGSNHLKQGLKLLATKELLFNSNNSNFRE